MVVIPAAVVIVVILVILNQRKADQASRIWNEIEAGFIYGKGQAPAKLFRITLMNGKTMWAIVPIEGPVTYSDTAVFAYRTTDNKELMSLTWREVTARKNYKHPSY